MSRRNVPHEYVVYQDRPPYPLTGGRSCVVRTMRIPRGQTFHDVRDSLPASMGQMRVVRAYSASSAKSGSGITCSSAQRSGISGAQSPKKESYAAYKRRMKRIAERARRTPGFIPYRADPYERD